MIACGRGGAIKTIKEAPKLKSKKVDRLFLASIFRSLTEKVISRDLIEGEIQKAVDEANSCSDEILKRTREDLADLRKAVADFERISGFRITTWPEDNQKLAKTIKDVFDGKYGTADEEIKKLRKSALNILFLDAMIDAPKELWHQCLVVIDEAHVFCPEKGESEAMGAVIDLMTRGRKRGFCGVLATQRLSKLHKDAAAEANNKLIGRTGLDVDMKRAAEELGFTRKDQYLSLRGLDAGEFFVFGPAISREVIKVKVGDVQTTHPRSDSKYAVIETAPPTGRIKAILKKLADLPRESKKEAQTISEFKQENSELRRQLRIAGQTKVMSPEEIDRAVKAACRQAEAEFGRERDKLWKMIDRGFAHVSEIQKIVEAATKERLSFRKESAPAPTFPERKSIPVEIIRCKEPILLPSRNKPVVSFVDDQSLKGPEQKILDAIAWMESIGISEPEQIAVAFLAGYTYGGGAFNNPKGSLRSRGMIEYRGNRIILTDLGRKFAKEPGEPLDTEELHRRKKISKFAPDAITPG